MMAHSQESMRVLMISPQFRPLYGGYERAAERLSGALIEGGLRVVVLSERRDPEWPSTEVVNGYEIRRLWCLYRRRLHSLTSLLSFAGFLLSRGREFDVWHVHQYGVHGGLAVALGKLLRRPVVLKLTNSGAMGIQMALGTGVMGRALRFLHRRVSACIAITEETRQEAIVFGIPSERIRLIPNGLDRHEFHAASPEEQENSRRLLGIECDRLFLSMGRLSDEKNPVGLIEAWAAVDPELRKGMLLVLVGDGPLEGEVKAKIEELGLAASVLLPGRRSDVANWYRAADLYVISSRNEGLSNSMIEALAFGLPVISTSVSGSSVLEEDPPAGLVVSPEDPRSLACAMEELLRDDARRAQLAMNARTKFETHFLMETVLKKTMLLYESLNGK